MKKLTLIKVLTLALGLGMLSGGDFASSGDKISRVMPPTDGPGKRVTIARLTDGPGKRVTIARLTDGPGKRINLGDGDIVVRNGDGDIA